MKPLLWQDILRAMESASSPYAAVDDTISRWVKRHALTLCTVWQGEARFWYTSRGNECFQISVDRPIGKVVSVHARSIDTDDDAELGGEWCVSLDHLDQGLVTATAMIELWANRTRLGGDSRTRS